MAKQKNNYRLNLVDVLASFIVISFLFLGIYAINYKPIVSGKNILVTMKVTSDSEAIYQTAVAQKEVYFGSSNALINVKKTEKINGTLFITLQGKGEIKDNNTVFNGQRLLIGQKSEIHGNYFAQGVITKIEYEN